MEFLNKNLSSKYRRLHIKPIHGDEFLLASARDKEYNGNSIKKLLLSALLVHPDF